MKNFTTCLTRPTGESYKSPGGIMRYMMLLLMCLVAGVGMAQTEASVTFTCGGTESYDFWQKNESTPTTVVKAPVTVTFSTVKDPDPEDVRLGGSGTITVTIATGYTITRVDMTGDKDFSFNGTTTDGKIICGTWSSNNVVLKNNTTSNFKVKTITVTYTTDGGSTSTDVAPTYVNISANPSTVKVGESFTLTAQADGTNPTYTWYKGSTTGTSIGTDATLSLTESTAGTYTYYCKAENSKGSVENSITVTVNDATVSDDNSPKTYIWSELGISETTTYKDNVNDITFNFDYNSQSDYFRFKTLTVTSETKTIEKIVLDKVVKSNPAEEKNANQEVFTNVELSAGTTNSTGINGRIIKCSELTNGLQVDVLNDQTVYVYQITVYYKEKNTTEEEYGIIIDHQNNVSVKPGGALSFKIVAHPDRTAGRNYEWYYNTKDSYDGGKLLGATADSKNYSVVVPQETGDYWYYSILTCRNQDTGNTVVYKSNRIHVIVTGESDGLVIVTPIGNVETTVYKQTKISLEVNEEDGCEYEYQWYKANGNSNAGGTLIEEATKGLYTFIPENIGTEYYYCIITRKENGSVTGTLTSRVGRVDITKATPNIDINDMKLIKNDGAKTFNIKATVGDETKTNVADKLTFKCTVANEEVATASISGNVLTVTPVEVGTTEITITSDADDNFNNSENVATITVANSANEVPGVLFKWEKGPNDGSGFKVPETEDDVYEGNVLLVRFAPDLPGVDYGTDGWTGITFDETNGTWTTNDGNKKYEIHYVTSDNENVKNGGTYKGSIRISQTMTIKAIVKDITDKNSPKWGDVCERTFMFNFTLLRTITDGLQIEAGKGYTIMDDDGRVYVTTTYGSVGDMGDPDGNNEQELWASAKKDPRMNGSEIVGFEYHSIGNKDARGENKWDYEKHKYAEHKYKYDGEADNKDLNTFDIPFTGAYFMFEPEVDGELNVIVRQNGIVGSNSDDLTKEVKKVVKRYAFVCDETGKSLPAVDRREDYEKGVRALISTKSLTESKGFAFLDEYTEDFEETDNVLDETGQQKKVTVRVIPKEDSDKKLKDYMEAFYKAQHNESEYTDETLSEKAKEYWNECRNTYLPEAGSSDKNYYTIDDKKYKKVNCDLPNVLAHDEYGWYTFGKAYVRYSFPVKAGKTYFMMGRWTKLAPCGYSFKRNNKNYSEWKKDVSERKVTVDGKHLEGDEGLVELIDTKPYEDIIYYTDKTDDNGDVIGGEREEYARSTECHITLDREFRAGVWTSLVLPFSMSPTSVREQFGIGTQIVHFNMVDNNKLYLTKHHHQMIVAGTPVFIKPTKKVSKVVVYGTYGQYETVKNYKGELVNQWKFPKIWEMDGNTDNGWKIKGSYTPTDVPVGAYLMGYNPESKVNNLRHITMKTPVPGTRAWIVNESADQEAKIEGLYINGVEDNTTTVIEEILYGEDPATVKGTRANGVYSLSGQLVRANTTDTTGLPAGIYIAGGRKVVVR